STTTAANGTASGTATLPAAAGPASFTASSGALTPVTFNATGTAGAAATLTIVSGNNQTGVAGSSLAAPLVVRVADTNNNPISGATVTWSSGVSPPSTTTLANGTASGTATLPAAAGPATFTA